MNTIKRLIVLSLILAPAAVLAEGMSLADIARLQQVGEIAISPDGQHVAFTRQVPRDLKHQDDGPAWSELHVIDADGAVRSYISGEVNVRAIDWLPDGSGISYLTRRDGASVLKQIPLRGGQSQKLAKVGEGVLGYSFDPAGGRVALIAFEEDDEDLKRQREMGFTQIIFEEDWKPRRLWIVDLNDDGNEAEPLPIEGSVQRVDWSPTGDRLKIVVTPRQLVDDTLMFQRIRIIDPQGAELGRIDNPGKLGQSAWSPDGEHIAFIATESIHDTREGRLMVAGKQGGEWLHLLPGLEGHVWHVDWLDADQVLFISYEGVEARLAVIGPDADNQRTLWQQDGLIFDAIAPAADGHLALAAHTVAHPREVFRWTEEGPERLTDSNPWLADRRLARQEVVVHPARDGLMIEGLLLYPLDYREGRRYPLILAAHGGPEAHYSNGWLTTYNLPAHHAAAEGYFMFYPNYRGSTGRGVAFTETSQGRPAREEFDDLVDGVDYLIEEGLVDADRVGITGGSYGGYASAWAATYYSERFAAAVMNVGLSDKIAMLGTSDIPQELYLVHYLTWPWEDWAMYREASPIYHVQNARTPILILHGDADPRVDPTQSHILYRYLVLQENPPPVRLVLYRGEGHGNQRAASRWDYSLRLMRWMDHYLKGDGGDPPPYQLDYGF